MEEIVFMKKLLSLISAGILVMSLAACSDIPVTESVREEPPTVDPGKQIEVVDVTKEMEPFTGFWQNDDLGIWIQITEDGTFATFDQFNTIVAQGDVQVADGTAVLNDVNGDKYMELDLSVSGDLLKRDDLTVFVPATSEPHIIESENVPEGLYDDFISIAKGADAKEWDGFTLVDLDGDGVPELVATCTNEENEAIQMWGLQPYMIVFYNEAGNEVFSEDLRDGVASAGGYRGTLYYIDGTRMVYDKAVYAPAGAPSDYFYELSNGVQKLYASGDFQVDNESLPTEGEYDVIEYGKWTWNGAEVSREDYEKNISDIIDNKDLIELAALDYADADAFAAQYGN